MIELKEKYKKEIEILKRKVKELECELIQSHECIIDLEKKKKILD